VLLSLIDLNLCFQIRNIKNELEVKYVYVKTCILKKSKIIKTHGTYFLSWKNRDSKLSYIHYVVSRDQRNILHYQVKW
jgi:hypothetical protein